MMTGMSYVFFPKFRGRFLILDIGDFFHQFPTLIARLTTKNATIVPINFSTTSMFKQIETTQL